MNDDVHISSVFMRHQRPLRALMLENQPWFAASDLGGLMGRPVEHFTEHSLDADLKRRERLQTHNGEQDTWLVCEAGLFNLLSRYRHPENRSLRQWITQEVIPALRGPTSPSSTRAAPCCAGKTRHRPAGMERPALGPLQRRAPAPATETRYAPTHGLVALAAPAPDAPVGRITWNRLSAGYLPADNPGALCALRKREHNNRGFQTMSPITLVHDFESITSSALRIALYASHDIVSP
jgi:Prophage antirepressor